MTEARLVTREQLAAALPNGAAFIAEALAGPEDLSNVERARLWVADAIFAALPAAAPADDEARREAYLRAYGDEQRVAAPAEGLPPTDHPRLAARVKAAEDVCVMYGWAGLSEQTPRQRATHILWKRWAAIVGPDFLKPHRHRDLVEVEDAALARHESAGERLMEVSLVDDPPFGPMTVKKDQP